MIAQTDHERVVGSGAWLGLGLGAAALGWADQHMPHALGFALDWGALLTVCYFMARWKRAWYGWVTFWGMAGLCVLGGVLQLVQPSASWSYSGFWVGVAIVFVWYWLVRVPRSQPEPAPQVSHVVHHHVFHGTAPATFTARPVASGERRSLPAMVRLSIGAPKSRLDALSEKLRLRVSR